MWEASDDAIWEMLECQKEQVHEHITTPEPQFPHVRQVILRVLSRKVTPHLRSTPPSSTMT